MVGVGAASMQSLGALYEALAESRVATSVVNLADGRVVFMNSAAKTMFGLDQASAIGKHASSLWSDQSTADSTVALSALMSGALESYQAHRTLPTATGVTQVSLWTRAVTVQHNFVAVGVLVPDDEHPAAERLLGAYFGPDAIDLTVGTLDTEGRLTAITANTESAIGVPHRDIEGSEIASLVHPDDLERFLNMAENAQSTPGNSVVTVRLRNPQGGWAAVRCVALRTGIGRPLRLAFALALGTQDAEARADADAERVAELEREVLRIAAEFHAVRLGHRDPMSAHESWDQVLAALPDRQHEVVIRLLRGERVAAIADALFVSRSTVRNHLSKVFRTVGATSQSELLSLLRSEHPGGAAE